VKNQPNKAPEPTTFAVTSRAIVRFLEMKQQNLIYDAARAAPTKVVAHLWRSAKMENQEETFSFKSLRHRRSWVSGHCFCRRARGLATRLTPRGKVQIKRTRHSGERVIARVVQDCVGALPRLLVPSVRTRSLPRASRFSSVRSSKFQPCRTRRQSQRWDLSRRVRPKAFFEMKQTEVSSYCCTRRASSQRGSSMTLGKNARNLRLLLC
jgi:hypothetical protein